MAIEMESDYFELIPNRPKIELDESISSFIIRLGWANRIHSIKGINLLFFQSHRSQYLNFELDLPPKNWEHLCKISRLQNNTFLNSTFYPLILNFNRSTNNQNISRFLKGSICNYLRYCPSCLADNPYYRLSWRLLHIDYCVEHECLLSDKCYVCGKRIPIFTYPSRIPFCPWCGSDLRMVLSDNHQTADVSKERIQDIKIIRSFTSPLPLNYWPGYINLSQFLASKFQRAFEVLNLSRFDISNALGIKSNRLWDILSGSVNRKSISFEAYFVLLNSFGISLSELIVTDWERKSLEMKYGCKTVLLPSGFSLKRETNQDNESLSVSKRDYYDLEEYYYAKSINAMRFLEDTKQKINISTVAKIVGVDRLTLYRYEAVRDLFHVIPLSTWFSRREITTEFMSVVEKMIIDKVKFPTNDEISAEVGIQIEYYPFVLQWLRQRREIYRHEEFLRSEKAILDRLEELKLDFQRMEERPTIRAICTCVHISMYYLKTHKLIQEKVKEILSAFDPVVLFQQRENELIEEIQKMQIEYGQGMKKINQSIIASRLHLTVPALKKYPRLCQYFQELGEAYRRRGGDHTNLHKVQ